MKKIYILFCVMLLMAGIVHSGNIAVDFPKTGDRLIAGKTYEITFKIFGCSGADITINIFRDSISKANLFFRLFERNSDGSVSWKVPLTTRPGNYVLRVSTEKACIGDSGVFKIEKLQALPGKPAIEIKKEFTAVPGVHLMAKKPEITWTGVSSWGHLPIKPGSRVDVKGVNFGSEKGQIIIKGNFPGGQVYLENVVWLNYMKVYGKVPMSLNGQPNQQVEIVVETSNGVRSDPFKHAGGFTGREEKILTADAVGVNCGNDGNINVCNGITSISGDIGAGEPYRPGCANEYAICGYHANVWGAVGDDSGNDTFYIDLKNGWVLKSIQVVTWAKSSEGELLTGPTPPFPAGSSKWTASIHWLVTPNDNVHYQIRIVVEGPIGTDHR